MSGLSDRGREAALARTFVTIADNLVDDYDVTDLFERLTAACVELLGATTAGLMLAASDGWLELAASSNGAMRTLQQLELTYDEGPCVDCYKSRRPVIADLRDPAALRRWPHVTPAATRASFRAVQALPMRLRGETIGALTVFHDEGSDLDDDETAVAQALADVGTIALVQRRVLASSTALSEQLQGALDARVVIEQAKGILAERGQLEMDQAFALLRQFCRSSRLGLTATARAIVTRRQDPDDVLAARWPASP